MILPDALTAKTAEELEEWFLAQLNSAELPAAPMTAVIQRLRELNHPAKAETCAEFLQDRLVAKGAVNDLISLLSSRAAWMANDASFTETCIRILGHATEKSPADQALLARAVFPRNLPAAECLRRIRTLLQIKPESLCYEKSWGFGVIVEAAADSQQVVIDFDKKKRHPMSLAYAAESLTILGEDHVLARKHRDPAGFAAWLQAEPAAVVKSILQAHGPFSVSRLQDWMTTHVIPPPEWKGFWERARKALKGDPLVELPAKRNESIRMLAKAQALDETWATVLLKERDFDRIFEQLNNWREPLRATELLPALRDAIEDRLGFVIQGTLRKDPAMAAEALLEAHELKTHGRLVQPAETGRALLQPDVLRKALKRLPARRVGAFLEALHAHTGEDLAAHLLPLLQHLAYPPLCEAIAYLQAIGQRTALAARLRTLITAREAGGDILYWLGRNPEFMDAEAICTRERLAAEALGEMENSDACGDRLKALALIRELFTQPEWLRLALAPMDAMHRQDFAVRLRHSPVWTPGECVALCNRMMELFPELTPVLDTTTVEITEKPRLTSWRMIQERRDQLHKIVNEDIPKNSQEIAVARSYGDLRENFEYKAAKDMQGILLRRQADLEQMIKEVKGSDFRDLPTDVAGMGTTVVLSMKDGRTVTYHLLGEWDSDEKRGIISSRTKLTLALDGKRAGEKAIIPGEHGPEECTVVSVSGLPDEIREWMKGA